MHATNLQNFLKLCEENVQSLNEKEENTSTSKEFLDKKKKDLCTTFNQQKNTKATAYDSQLLGNSIMCSLLRGKQSNAISLKVVYAPRRALAIPSN